ncbi:FKBP-type peptidyl-prolyl cis-trans isomerase / Macrophage infectivity potentiator [Pseudomonas syringae pv. papulans]|nr:FKBP-type peptidyl-prolyl cis-trans isomerase / Macrophage infectivity potentiator [Pseudomonas syringae pv. papulans]RMN72202.1 Peptidyl-prolyl cis-trans isomerase [Pseudomonas syringae pv. papulans]
MPVAIDRGGLISSRLYSFALLAHEQGISMKQHRLAAAIALVGLVLAGCDKQASTVELKTPAQKASYGIGLNMGKSLAQEGMDDLDSKAVALGIEDAVGKKDQKLKDEELVEAFSALQKRSEERLAKMSEEASAAGKKFLEENGKKDGVVTTASGLQYQIIKKADGPQPKPTDVVTVHYEGKLIDGKVFDSSVERGSPIDLPVGGVIPGWVEGLQLMHVGEKIKLFIPSDLAYGAQSPSPAIPANSVLVFDLELLGIKDPAAAPTAGADADEEEEEEAAPATSAPAKK